MKLEPMDSSEREPLRALFTNVKEGLINPLTEKSAKYPSGMLRPLRKKHLIDYTIWS